MKNFKDLFDYYDLCPLCGDKDKNLSVFYSKFPRGKLDFSISKNNLNLIIDSCTININIHSNKVMFGPESFGALSGGDYIFSFSCSSCKNVKYEAYSFYNKNGMLEPPKLLSEYIIVNDDDNGNDTEFSYYVDYLSDESVLQVYRSGETRFVKLPLIKLFSLPNSKEKLINKFKNFLLLS